MTLITDSYTEFQREAAAHWCQMPDDVTPCPRLCGACREEAHRAINAAFVAQHPFDCALEPTARGSGRNDIRFIDRDSEEGLAIQAERAARGGGPESIDAELTAAMGSLLR
ncbi:MAG: hypothetical protein H0W41_05475 [Chloroflexi bacterium]|nr:hypothetical protein [Chloroflexota bacterium]